MRSPCLAGVPRRFPRLFLTFVCVLILPAFAGLVTSFAADATPATPAYRLIGYVMPRTDIARIPATKLTHLNYAFALVSPAGEVHLPGPNDPQHLAALVALKQRNPRLRVLLSVGGWGADHFSDAALTDASRERFARSALALVTANHLDGLDLDWEYPGQPGPGIKFRPEDKINFTRLLETLRRELDAASAASGRHGSDRYLLSIASSDGTYFEHTEMSVLHRFLDWINVMTYDRYGVWSKTTGHHAGLFASAREPASASTTASVVGQHLAAGIPPDKIVVGAAFYGRGWTGVRPLDHGLLQPYATVLRGNLSYGRLMREFTPQQGFERHWDPAAHAAWLWNAASATFITYEDPDALRAKADLVRDQNLGGVMYWEQSHDPDGELVEVLYHALHPAP